jgi:hypothetical protein
MKIKLKYANKKQLCMNFSNQNITLLTSVLLSKILGSILVVMVWPMVLQRRSPSCHSDRRGDPHHRGHRPHHHEPLQLPQLSSPLDILMPRVSEAAAVPDNKLLVTSQLKRM